MKRLFLLLAVLIATFDATAALPKLIPYRKGNLWGYADSTKKIIIAPRFERASFFSGNTAVVRMGDLDGLIDTTGKIVVPCTFYGIYPPAHRGSRLFRSGPASENNGLINEKGEVLLEPIDGYLAWAGDYLISCRCDRRIRDVALFSWNGKMITGYLFQESSDGFSATRSSAVAGVFVLQKKSGIGVIDSTGREIIPFSYDSIAYYGRFRCVKGKGVTCFTRDGAVVDCGGPARTKKYPVPVTSGDDKKMFYKNAWQDSTGKVTKLPAVKQAQPFIRGYAVFMDTTLKSGIVDENFRVVIPAKYSTVMGFDENGISFVRIGQDKVVAGKWVKGLTGYIDVYGTEYWED